MISNERTPPVHARRLSWRSAGYGAAAAAALGLPWLLDVVPGLAVGYVLYLICLGIIYSIVALGLNLLVGYAGQFSLGHAGFLAIGAYTSAILTTRLGWSFALALPAAGALTATIGYLLGLPALRLSSIYLAVVTLGFGLAIQQVIVWQDTLTGGSSGLHGLPAAAIPIWYDPSAGVYQLVFRTDRDFYYLALAMLAVLLLLASNIVNSHTGRALIAIRDSELAAQAMGVNLVRYKTTAFALSAFYAGIAGGLYAHLLHGISPEDFSLFLSVEFLTMIVLGGLGSIRGALLGAFLITALQNLLTRLPLVRDFKNLSIVVFGAVLIATIMFLPQGIAGALRRPFRPAARRPLASAPDAAEQAPIIDRG